MARRGENIYKRKDGRWEGRYYKYSENGKRKYNSVYAHSYSEVKHKLNELKAKTKNNASCSLTVKELFEEWFGAILQKVKPSTYYCYKTKVKKHILSAFGSMKYDRITVEKIQGFINDKIGSGLSAKYVCDIIVVFKSMSKYISKIYGIIDRLKNVILPKAEKKEAVLMTMEQQKQLCMSAMKSKGTTKLAVLLGFNMGLRIGEICGLKWEDIDLDDRTIIIKRTVQRIYENGATKLYISSPKSKSSARTIPIPEFLLSILKEYKGKGFILSGSEKIIEPRLLHYRFKSMLKKEKMPSFTFHSLRHTFATNCIRLGFDVKTLSEILGHSTVEITLNRYVHSSIDRKRSCMNMIKKSF